MKKYYSVIVYSIVTFLFAVNSFAWETDDGRLKVGGTYSIDVYYDHVYGNVLESSKDVHQTKKDNYHYTEELAIHLEGGIKEDLNLKFDFTGRHSTDKNVQTHRYELVDLYLGLTGKNYEIAFGDIPIELFSNYSFHRDFFGFKANYEVEDLLTFKVLAGRNKMRREDQYERVFGGGMIVFTPHPDYEFRTSFIHTEITDLYPNATETNFRNDVWTLGSTMNFFEKRVTLAGEVAFSDYVVDRRDPLTERLYGFATWAILIFKPIGEELILSFTHEYVDPDFLAVMGAHNIDKETFLWYIDYNPSEIFRLESSYQFYRNRLTEESAELYRTNTHNANTTIILSPLIYEESYFKNLILAFDIDCTYQKSEDIPESVNSQIIIANISAGNKIERYWGEMAWTLGLGLTYNIDNTLHAEDDLTTGFNTTFNYSTYAYGFDFDFNLGFSVEFEDMYIKYPKETLTKTTAILGPMGLTITSNRWLPYKTTLGVGYTGTFVDEELGYDTIENVTTVSLSQVLFRRGDIISTIGLSYSNLDCRSQNPIDRYGEDEYRVTFGLKF